MGLKEERPIECSNGFIGACYDLKRVSKFLLDRPQWDITIHKKLDGGKEESFIQVIIYFGSQEKLENKQRRTFQGVSYDDVVEEIVSFFQREIDMLIQNFTKQKREVVKALEAIKLADMDVDIDAYIKQFQDGS